MRTPWMFIAAAAALQGCMIGATPRKFGPAVSPKGVETRLTLPGRVALVGELLSVSDSGLLVLVTGRRMVHAYWPALREATFRQVRARIQAGRPPDARTRERVRMVSRFPYGMAPELTARLLESLGIERIEVVRGAGADPAGAARAAAGEWSESLFVSRARAGTARYHELDSAITDGFRRIGGDFPGMGEHWVHAGRLMASVVDPARPAILSYAAIGGRPALVGVAYAVPLRAGEPVPELPRDAWHAHAGSVGEASFLPSHAGHMADPGARIAVLHAWVWLENPAGTFATDNPALPFARAGIRAEAASPPALRALALGYGAIPFYSEAISRSGNLGAERRAAIVQALEAGAARARAEVAAAHAPLRREALEEIWKGTWDVIAAVDANAAAARDLGF